MSRQMGGDPQLAASRHQIILDTLRSRGQVGANALADTLGVTHETVRKDLVHLQGLGLLRRVHGGAVPVEALTHEVPVGGRTAYGPEKTRIADAALQFVPESGAVLVDSGTTTAAFGESLPALPNLVAFTNSLPIALALVPRLGGVTILGGRVRAATLGTADAWAVRALEGVRADVAFLGANAISSEHGLATPDEIEAELKAALIRSSRLRVLLADHSKFGRESVHRYAVLSDIDVLVTDTGLPQADADAITRDHGVEVIRA
ncbi:DeoR/GlpR family DNA-binding transcription regulator [Nostocoides vanveenii]|uniref:Lactose phosphotransferase system repressor n=1 Tax=Nostocoides vanveenii TaxID=330835 RepID=A0ABP4XB49_9MICO